MIKKLIISLPLIFAVGCGAKQAPVTKTTNLGSGIPSWYKTNPKCGYGAMKVNGGDIDMAITMATSRAKGDLASSIEATVKRLVKDYRQSGSAEGEDFYEGMQQIASKESTNMVLQGAAANQVENIQGTMYTQVCLDPDSFAGMFDKMKNMGEKRKAALRNNAKKAWEELDNM